MFLTHTLRLLTRSTSQEMRFTPRVSKFSWRACWPVLPALFAGALLSAGIGQQASDRLPLDDWDIPQLVAYLNGHGMGLRVVSTRRDGVISQTAFLTTTDQEWEDLNGLAKDENQIVPWQGILYCVRGPGGDDWADLASHWGDRCLIVGPYLFYGDRELLGRVRVALSATPSSR
jgi:hypothetical protein